MKYYVSDKSTEMTRRQKRKRIWYKVVSVMASVVVFCTTYALILPAITMTEDYYCGMEAHEHSEECYLTGTVKTSICQALPHQHDESCYDEAGGLKCGLADFFIHSHSTLCYDGNGKLICEIPEKGLHQHSEDCYLGEKLYSCGNTETEIHEHDETCYAEENVCICDIPETPPHQHTEECYGIIRDLVCGQVECSEHIHSETCHGVTSVLVCTLPEQDAHFHSEGCYEYIDVLSCTIAEGEDHSHTDDCYSREQRISCSQEETAGHQHTEACYIAQDAIVCGIAETPGHTHTEECYGNEQVLECEIPEGEGHVHADTCFEIQLILQCEKPVGEGHVHDDTCILISEPVLVCTKLETTLNGHSGYCCTEEGTVCESLIAYEHVHTEECFHVEEIPEPVLICTLEEHVHELICTSDKTADLETAEIWRITVPSADSRTGILADDLLAVAKSQIGYQESSRNFIIAENDERKGYTRYGQWYGYPYGDWCAMYVSFCMYYAGIPDEVFPYECGCQRWIDDLDALGLYMTVQEHTPAPGDVVFFGDAGGNSTHVGIVFEVTEDQIKTIEGNLGNCVGYSSYALPDGNGYILGYGSMEAAYSRGIECGLLEPIPEEEQILAETEIPVLDAQTTPEEVNTSDEVKLEAVYDGVTVKLTAPANAFPETESELCLSITGISEETKKAVTELIGAGKTTVGMEIQVLIGDQTVQNSTPVELEFILQDLNDSEITLYRINTEQVPEVEQQEVQLQEDGIMILPSAQLGTYVIAYHEQEDLIHLQTQWENLQFTLDAPSDAFDVGTGTGILTVNCMDDEILNYISAKFSSFKTVYGVDICVLMNEEEVQPSLPVRITVESLDGAFQNAEDFAIYQYCGLKDDGALVIEKLDSSLDDAAGLHIDMTQLSGLIISYEMPYDGIELETDFGDIHIRLRAPWDAFPVNTGTLTLVVTEPDEAMQANLSEAMGDDQPYFAVDIQILCDGQPIQPNGDVQVIFEMNKDPFVNSETVEVFHVVADDQNQITGVQQVEGGRDENGDVVMETDHFSTYVVAGAEETPVTYATDDVPPNTWAEAMTDRSSYVGVESEGYADSPYTNTRQFEGANITSLTNSGGTVYVGGKWGIYYDYAFYAETFWDGKKPVRITSEPGHQNDLRKSVYSDWILEDTVDPYGALKIDNVNLVLYGLGNQKFELYGRGNKIVIGENVNTDDLMSHSPPYIYGGSRTNDSTTSGYPTNVVVTSGRWGLVMGGGGADVNDGTQVTIRDTAEVGIIYGGGIDDGDVNKGSSENATNVYIEGGKVTEVYGGNQTTSRGIKVNGDINIDVSGGQVGTIHAGNDHRGIEGTDELKGSKVRGGAVVNVYNTGSVTNVVGDYMHYDATYGDQLITFQGANGQYTTKGRHIRDLVELNIHSNNEFGYMDYWDIIRINNLDANAAPNSVNVTSLQGVVKIGDRVVNNVGSEYIGRMEVTNGGRFYVKDNCFINFMNEVNTTSEEGVTSFNLNHAWMGEPTQDRQAWSTLAVEGSCIAPSTAATNLFTLSNPCDDGRAGLRIKGNVEGFSTLEACGEPMYSTGDTYYYYVVADSSDNGGKAFREPEGAPYVVCYRYLEDGRIGWYLRERPVLTMTNSLVRVGTEGILTPTDNGFYGGCPENYVIMHVDMKGFAYEWSNTPGKNRVEFEWSIFDGYENASETTGGISLETMADIENNIYCTSNPNGIFANVEYNAMGTDEGSTEQTKRVSSFYVIIDTSKAVNPRYYEVNTSFHYTRGEDDYDDLRVGQTADAARCTYDFANNKEVLGHDGYANSVMTTYEYSGGVPPKGEDDALLRVYIPEGVTANTLTVKELDEQFTFRETGKAASLVSSSLVSQHYSTENESTYNHKFGVTLQQAGSSEIDLAGGATLNNLSGKEIYHCAVYSHEKISFTDITPESNLGLQLQLQLNNLTKDGNAVGNGDPSAVNDGELRIQVYPVGTIIETTKVNIQKIVTGENPSTNTPFDFLLSYPKIDENGQKVTHEERFTLKHNEVKTIIVPLNTTVTVREINHDGYWVQVQSTMTTSSAEGTAEQAEPYDEGSASDAMVYSDMVILQTPEEVLADEEQYVIFYNSPGTELPESGGFGTSLYTFLGLLLTLGAILLLWMHRRERGTVC